MAAVTRSDTLPPRTLKEALASAHAQGLEPYTSENGRWIGFDCPVCKSIGRKGAATVEQLEGGFLQASCGGCKDNLEPGVLATLGVASNVIPIHTPNGNGTQPGPVTQTLGAQTWRSFEQTAGNDVPCIIKDLWPEGGLGFIGAAPKAGKTWLGIDIAVAVATATPVFGSFTVPNALPVLYVALEGHRAAIRTRIGCIARGRDINPEHDGLENLHLAYKPKGINLHDISWATALCDEALALGCRLVIVDVLRRAAQIKENDASSFMELVDRLNPISEQGVAIGMLHHFNKVNENTSTRTPAERMAGSGAMFGAFDVGLFITKSEDGARKLEVHTDIRDLAAPDKFIVNLTGDGTGAYGGFTYRDSLRLIREDVPEPIVKGSPLAIRSFIIENDGQATPRQLRDHFDIVDATLRERRDDLEKIGVHYISEGAKSRYEVSYALPRSAPRSSGAGQYPAVPRSDPIAGSEATAPQSRTLEGRGAGAAGQSIDSDQNPTAGHDRGADEVLLDQEDDEGFWRALEDIEPPNSEGVS